MLASFSMTRIFRLFEMGFGEQLREILGRLPENRQTVLFSATLPKLLVDFAKAGLTDPTLIRKFFVLHDDPCYISLSQKSTIVNYIMDGHYQPIGGTVLVILTFDMCCHVFNVLLASAIFFLHTGIGEHKLFYFLVHVCFPTERGDGEHR